MNGRLYLIGKMSNRVAVWFFIINVNLQNNQNRRMRSFLIALFARVAVVNAEKYAMVFGAAHGWNNYPVYSVSSWT